MFLNNYQYIVLNYTLALLHQYYDHHLLAYAVSNGAYFLNIAFLLTSLFAWPWVAVFIVIKVIYKKYICMAIIT